MTLDLGVSGIWSGVMGCSRNDKAREEALLEPGRPFLRVHVEHALQEKNRIKSSCCEDADD